jgi:hypothetical protein
MESCCEDERNLGEPEQVEEREDLVVRVCQVCGRRHFEMTVDPVKVGVHVASLAG